MSKPAAKKRLTDLILRKRVEIAILSTKDIDAYLLEISVEDGIVTLSGQLHSNAEKAAAEKQAYSVEGVNDLQNDIKVVEYRTNPLEH